MDQLIRKCPRNTAEHMGEYTKYPESQVVQSVQQRTRGMTEQEAGPQ